jgi:hypothetical protein
MTHIFTDEEFAQFQKDMSELKNLRIFKNKIIENAEKWIKENKGCEEFKDVWCYNCPVLDIFGMDEHYGCFITHAAVELPK